MVLRLPPQLHEEPAAAGGGTRKECRLMTQSHEDKPLAASWGDPHPRIRETPLAIVMIGVGSVS